MEAVNLDKIDKMALITFQNVVRLHLDSITLFMANSYPSAFYLSVIALEELGKIFLISDFLYDSRVTGRYNEYKSEELFRVFGKNLEEGYFKKIVFNHKRKQFHFVRTFDREDKPSTQYFKKIADGTIENEKQNSLYVGLKRFGKKIDMKSPIINPLKLTKKTSEYQINLIHKCLLELTLYVWVEAWTTDSNYLDDYLDANIYNDLKTKWDIKERRFINKLKKVEKNSKQQACLLR